MKIRFGIVGCGFLGNIIANAWKDGFLEDYELVGVTNRTQESRDKTAAETGCRSCRDLAELLSLEPEYIVEVKYNVQFNEPNVWLTGTCIGDPEIGRASCRERV